MLSPKSDRITRLGRKPKAASSLVLRWLEIWIYIYTFSCKVLHKRNKIRIYLTAVKMISPVKVWFKAQPQDPSWKQKCCSRDPEAMRGQRCSNHHVLSSTCPGDLSTCREAGRHFCPLLKQKRGLTSYQTKRLCSSLPFLQSGSFSWFWRCF